MTRLITNPRPMPKFQGVQQSGRRNPFSARATQSPAGDMFLPATDVHFEGKTTRRNLLLSAIASLGILAGCGGGDGGGIVDTLPPDPITCQDPVNGTVDIASVVNTAGITWQALGDESQWQDAAPLNIAKVPEGIRLSWSSSADGLYQLQSSSNLKHWVDVGQPMQGTGGEMEVIEPTHQDQQFYRLLNLAGQSVESARQSKLTIPLNENALMCDAGAISLETPIENTAFGNLEYREIPVLSSRLKGHSLELVLDGPVSQGAELFFDDGAIVTYRGPSSAEGSVMLDNAELLPPEQATRWFKAFTPGNEQLFTPAYSGAGSGTPIPQPQDEATVFSNLNLHLRNFMDAGFLSLDETTELMNRFYDPAARAVFTDPKTGRFEPFLMAATLATVGTASSEAVNAMIDGENETGRPARMVFEEISPGLLAEVEIITDTDGQPRWLVRISPNLKGEPLQAVSALIAHEGMHDDALIGQDEEVMGKAIETKTWAHQLLADPLLASLGTPLTKLLNQQLLAHLNSGQNFPVPGLFEATLLQTEQQVLPGSSADARSFDDAMRKFVYPNTPTWIPPVTSIWTGFCHWAINP